jgi:hypothetical protein
MVKIAELCGCDDRLDGPSRGVAKEIMKKQCT